MRRHRAAWCGALALMLAATGCTATMSPFWREAGKAGSGFAAAMTTLTYAHEGKLPVRYARGSFAGFESELAGIDQRLPTLDGAPDSRVVRQLVAVAGPALRAVRQPCLDEGCDWRGQVAALQRASAAFLAASGG